MAKQFDRNEASDTGAESLRLGVKTVRKTEKAVKTTNHAVKTAVKTTKRAVRITARAVKTTAKVVEKISATVAKSVASLSPAIAVLVAVFLLLVIAAGVIVVIIGSTAGATGNIRHAYENAEGLPDPAAGYADGAAFYQTAMTNAQNAFDAQIDALYFAEDDLQNSVLVYFERTSSGSPDAKLSRSELASDSIKTQIKDTWLPCLTEQEVLAIAYVYLQKQENDAHGTDAALYMVAYTQDALDTVVAALYAVTETVHAKQECPGKDCAVHQVVNPSWTYCDEKMGEAAKIINGEVTGDVEQARRDYENWSAARDAYPQYIDEDYCPKEHDNHSIALTFYDKDSVLAALGLDGDRYAKWVDMTITGFENNAEIP